MPDGCIPGGSEGIDCMPGGCVPGGGCMPNDCIPGSICGNSAVCIGGIPPAYIGCCWLLVDIGGIGGIPLA